MKKGTPRYSVEVFHPEVGGRIEHEGNNRRIAIRKAEEWHEKGHAVIVHDRKTGEKIYDEM